MREPVSSSIIVQQDALVAREDEEEELASDVSTVSVDSESDRLVDTIASDVSTVSVDSESERLADTTVSDVDVELGETDGHIRSLELNPSVESHENGVDVLDIVVPRNSPYSISKSAIYRTFKKNQDRVRIKVLQGKTNG